MASNLKKKEAQKMNDEFESMANRSVAIIESLYNLGHYFIRNGAYTVAGVQAKVGQNISKEEYVASLYAMEILSRVTPKKEKPKIHDEYIEALYQRIDLRRHSWLKNLLMKLFTRNSLKRIEASLKKSPS